MSVFRFKQFEVQQKYAAARVGTDGVLLGAWANPKPYPKLILDIGTGTGLIALMMAQRFSKSLITALEIEENAYTEAQFNFDKSPWKERLQAVNTSLQSYETVSKFDLIISNPPFYKEDTLSHNYQRSLARSVSHLPFQVLIEKSAALLSQEGTLAVIIPFTNEDEFLFKSRSNKLYPNKICRVQGHATSPIKRSLLALSHKPTLCEVENIVIEESRHFYTPAYKSLTQEFYLKM